MKSVHAYKVDTLGQSDLISAVTKFPQIQSVKLRTRALMMMMYSPLLWLQLCLVVCYGFRTPILSSLYKRSPSSSIGLVSQQVHTCSGSSAASNLLSSCTLGSHSADASAEVYSAYVSIVYRIKRLLAPVMVSCGLVLSGISSSVCYAAVGEGDLPPGAMAFTKILKYQVGLLYSVLAF